MPPIKRLMGVVRFFSWVCMLFLIIWSSEVARDDASSRYVGEWQGSRAYHLADLVGTETFTMTVTRLDGGGVKAVSLTSRPRLEENPAG